MLVAERKNKKMWLFFLVNMVILKRIHDLTSKQQNSGTKGEYEINELEQQRD